MGHAEILYTINKNRVHSFKNVAETATIGFQEFKKSVNVAITATKTKNQSKMPP